MGWGHAKMAGLLRDAHRKMVVENPGMFDELLRI